MCNIASIKCEYKGVEIIEGKIEIALKVLSRALKSEVKKYRNNTQPYST